MKILHKCPIILLMLFSVAERKQRDSKILGTATVEVESKPVGKRKSTRIAAIEEKKKMTFTEELSGAVQFCYGHHHFLSHYWDMVFLYVNISICLQSQHSWTRSAH